MEPNGFTPMIVKIRYKDRRQKTQDLILFCPAPIRSKFGEYDQLEIVGYELTELIQTEETP